MSDAALIAIVTGIVTIVTTLGTIWLRAKMDMMKNRMETKLEGIEIKIDGRLTKLLEVTADLAEARGLAAGKDQGRDDQKSDIKEFKKGDMNIAAGSVDITTKEVNLGEKKKDGDKPKPE